VAEATIYYPSPDSEVTLSFVAYGTSEDIQYLSAILQKQDDNSKPIAGQRLEDDGSFWSFLFSNVSPGDYTFYLLGFPGGLLGSVPNIEWMGGYGGSMSQPPQGAQNLTACLCAAGSTTVAGLPSGKVTRLSDGKTYQGFNAKQIGSSWSIQFTVDATPVTTSLFNLHVDVGGTGLDNNGLGIPNPCS
jgi:hypothetical protein